MPTGDKVIFPLVNQRVDKKDLDDMMVLIQETISRTIGSILGEGSGALTTIPYTWNQGDDTATLGACMLAYSRPRTGSSDPNAFNFLEGGVVIHDPNRPAQNGNSIVALNGLTSGHLWFKRNTVDADIDNRAHWPGPGSGEVVTQTPTRNREYVTFAATQDIGGSSTINTASGWNRFGNFIKLAFLGSTVLQIVPLSAFGDDRGAGGTQASFMGYWSTNPTQRVWGLNRLAQDVISSVLQIEDSDVKFDPVTRAVTENPNNTLWRNPPPIGLRQVSLQLSSLESQLTSLISTVTELNNNYLSFTNRFTQIFDRSPIILGFVYATPEVANPGPNPSFNFRYTLTVNFGFNAPAGESPLGLGSFTAEIVPVDVGGGELAPALRDYGIDIKFSVKSTPASEFNAIDYIQVTSGMRQDWRTGGTEDAPPNQRITGDTRVRAAVVSNINYPKFPSSVPQPLVDDPTGTASLENGQFIIRVKPTRERVLDGQSSSSDARPEPFTMIVYGRTSLSGRVL